VAGVCAGSAAEAFKPPPDLAAALAARAAGLLTCLEDCAGVAEVAEVAGIAEVTGIAEVIGAEVLVDFTLGAPARLDDLIGVTETGS